MKKNYSSGPDSLKKSHSVWSNTKLTFLCLITALALAVLVIGVAMLVKGYEIFPLIMVIGGGVLTALCLALFVIFKR